MVEGLKETLQYITGLKAESMEPKLLEINGETYCTKDLTRYHNFPMARDLSVNTLTALVDYIKGKPEELRESSILHVVSPTKVLLFSGLIDERNRETLMAAGAIVNEFRFDDYYDQERFLIELQANFVDKGSREQIFKQQKVMEMNQMENDLKEVFSSMKKDGECVVATTYILLVLNKIPESYKDTKYYKLLFEIGEYSNEGQYFDALGLEAKLYREFIKYRNMYIETYNCKD